MKLLRRSNRHVNLTDEGAALYAHAAPALEALRESEAAVTEMRSALKGRIRITAPVGIGMQVLQPVVSHFLAQHPDTNVEAVFTMRVVDLVGEGFDLALRGGPLEDEDLIARQVGVGDASLFAAPSYLEQHGMPLSVADLAGRDFVLLKGCLHKHDEIYLAGPEGEQRVPVRQRIVSDHFPFVLQAAVDGVGICLLPIQLCQEVEGRGELWRILPDYSQPGRPLYLVYPRNRYLPRRVAAFRDAILESRQGV